jgi:hypothetical protein
VLLTTLDGREATVPFSDFVALIEHLLTANAAPPADDASSFSGI